MLSGLARFQDTDSKVISGSVAKGEVEKLDAGKFVLSHDINLKRIEAPFFTSETKNLVSFQVCRFSYINGV